LRLFVASYEQPRDRFHQLRAHLLGSIADMLERAAELCLSLRWCQPGEQEAITHRADDGVVRVDHAGGGGDQPDFALPMQGATTVAAQVPGPAAVINLAQRSQRLGLGLRMH
jgi:hypothetical protein